MSNDPKSVLRHRQINETPIAPQKGVPARTRATATPRSTWQADDQQGINLPRTGRVLTDERPPRSDDASLPRTATGRSWSADRPTGKDVSRESRTWTTKTTASADVAVVEADEEETSLVSPSPYTTDEQQDIEDEELEVEVPPTTQLLDEDVREPEVITFTPTSRRSSLLPRQTTQQQTVVPVYQRRTTQHYLEPIVASTAHRQASPEAFGFRRTHMVLGASLFVLLLLTFFHVVSLLLAVAGIVTLLTGSLLISLLLNWHRQQHHPAFHLGIALIALLFGSVFLFQVYILGVTHYDDIRYGTPRTSQFDAVVGHHDSALHQTHFIALNYRGRVEIIEFAGGDSTHSKVYLGPQLLWTDAQKAVVTLEAKDMNHDGKTDLIVHVNAEPASLFSNPSFVYVLVNTGDGFRQQQAA